MGKYFLFKDLNIFPNKTYEWPTSTQKSAQHDQHQGNENQIYNEISCHTC